MRPIINVKRLIVLWFILFMICMGISLADVRRYYAIDMTQLPGHTPEDTFEKLLKKGAQSRGKVSQPRDITHYIDVSDQYRVIQITCDEDDKNWFDSKIYAEFIGLNIYDNTPEQRVNDWIDSHRRQYLGE